MTVNAIELALHDLSVKREARGAFAHDAAVFLKGYRLDATEASMVAGFDVGRLLKVGVSPLLTYGFWMMNAPVKTRAAYLERVRQAG
ncbi:MAG TPA: hypothetical protein PKD73_01305 [Burkholderiaceae bacterium]|nr:hypothetical protein [Burkholderiaceae bacterium]